MAVATESVALSNFGENHFLRPLSVDQIRNSINFNGWVEMMKLKNSYIGGSAVSAGSALFLLEIPGKALRYKSSAVFLVPIEVALLILRIVIGRDLPGANFAIGFAAAGPSTFWA